jgi:hypothetical protein
MSATIETAAFPTKGEARKRMKAMAAMAREWAGGSRWLAEVGMREYTVYRDTPPTCVADLWDVPAGVYDDLRDMCPAKDYLPMQGEVLHIYVTSVRPDGSGELEDVFMFWTGTNDYPPMMRRGYGMNARFDTINI